MCGIFGIITKEEQALGPIMTEAGHMLSYRGYDTVGAATFTDNNSTIDLRKDVGKVDDVAQKHNFANMHGTRGILQLRWATFGAPTAENAQPHIDSNGDLVGAHNGNVINNFELREQFIAEGMTVRSVNDGETCVHAIERYVSKGLSMVEAIRKAYHDLEGDYSFIVGRVDEDKLHAIKKGSGMVVGITDGATCLSSDLPSILPITRNIIRINDGEMVTMWADRIEIQDVISGEVIERTPELVTESMESVQKGGYPHFMLKEIHEQPKVAHELLELLDNTPEIAQMAKRMKNARNLYLVACGTSFHACEIGSVYINRLAGKASIPILAPQFIAQYANSLQSDDVALFVSQSGETKDVLNAVKIAQSVDMGILGMVNVIGSALTLVSEHWLPLACGYEISVPATKTFTNQVIGFLYLAAKMGGVSTEFLHKIPELMERTISDTADQISSIAPEISKWSDLYCLGYGLTYPIALEGALKLKEITYAHCEGMLSTEFKHGPLSAVVEGFPLLFSAGKEDIDLIVSGINEVTCRGGKAYVVGEESARLSQHSDVLIKLPEATPEISALLSVIPLQLLSYEISIARGYDPDFPRNLSKTLTVD